MKKRLTILKSLIVLCGAFAATASFGQTTYVWTGPNGGDIGVATNWTPNGQPSGASQDTAEWNGGVAGNLSLIYATGWPSTGFGTSGVNLDLTTNQIDNVTIVAPTAGSPAAGIFGITNDSPSAAFTLGDATSHLLNLATRPGNAGTIHSFVNNSSSAAVMNSSIAWVAGGGVACVMDFGGTGNWTVNHNLRDNNSGAGPITIILDGPGTMNWTAGGTFLASDPLGPIGINGGKLVLESAGLAPSFTAVAAGNNTITNDATLEYNAAGADTISRVILGTGSVQVNNGTLTLSGANTYTGNTLLTGGELIVGGPETVGTSGPLGVSNLVSFAGGTLGFSVNNTFDYSSRFSTAAGQAYGLDTGGQLVTLASGLASVGGTLTKVGSGTLTLSGTNSYGGLTTISAGKLVFQSIKSGSGNITVANSTALGVTGGTQITPNALTLGTTSGATLEFNNVTSTSSALIAANSLTAGGAVTVNVNSGIFAVGQSYPLFSWGTGAAPAVTLGSVNGAVGNLSTNGTTITLNITGLAFVWTGLNNGNWDTNTANNWKVAGSSSVFANGGGALFDDTATGTTNVTLNGPVLPAIVTINNNSKTYSITSSSGDDIGGSGGLTKSGTGTATLSGGANVYTGVTVLNGGTLSVSTLDNGGSASDIGEASSAAANLVLNGGTLQYTGGAAGVNHLFTLGTAGGTIDSSGSGALDLSNPGSIAFNGTGARVLTMTGTDTDTNTLAASLADNSGATSLTKNGAGTWIVTGNNTQSGVTTIAAGELQIGTGGMAGSLGSGSVVDNGVLDFNVSGTLTIGAISGTGSVILDGSGTVVLPGNNSYAAGTTINAGTLQVGTGGATGQLDASSAITDNGALIFNSTGALTLSGAIGGTGTVEAKGSGLLKFIGNNTYTGITTIDLGAELQLWQGNTGASASSAIIDNGTLLLERQDNGVAIYAGDISGTGSLVVNVSNGNAGDSTLTGTNTYTGGTYILGGGLILGDGATPGSGAILGDIFTTNNVAQATFGPFVPATITFDRADDFTFPGNIVGQGTLTQEGNDRLTLTGANNYTNGTTISAGVIQVGAGGTSGSIGAGAVVDNAELDFDRSDSVTFTNGISGGGAVAQLGSGSLTIESTNDTYSGSTTVSNGILVIADSAVGGDLDVNGGTLVAGGLTAVTTLNVGGAMNISGGTVLVSLNKSLAQSNTVFSVDSGSVNITGGTLKVVNLGAPVVVGDQFTLFNVPVNVTNLTIDSPGFTLANNLATNGSVVVTAVAPAASQKITATFTGGQLNLSWPVTGMHLQVQTNLLTKGLSTNWVNVSGSTTTNSFSAAITTNGAVFYRLAP